MVSSASSNFVRRSGDWPQTDTEEYSMGEDTDEWEEGIEYIEGSLVGSDAEHDDASMADEERYAYDSEMDTPPGDDDDSSLQIHPSFCYSDGDLWITTGEVLYQIHWNMIANLSWGLRDIIQQLDVWPGRIRSPSLGESTVLYWVIDDNKRMSLELVLNFLYTGCRLTEIQLEDDPDTYMGFLERVFNIADEWEIASLRLAATEALAHLFPYNLRQYEETGYKTLESPMCIDVARRALDISSVYDIVLVRPMIYYCLCQLPKDYIVAGYRTSATTRKVKTIPSNLIPILLRGREMLLRRDLRYLQLPLDEKNAGRFGPCQATPDEMYGTACQSRLTEISLKCASKGTSHPLQDPFESEDNRAVLRKYLCPSCYSAIVQRTRDVQEDMWNELPLLFDMGTWGGLQEAQKDEDEVYEAIYPHGDSVRPHAPSPMEVDVDWSDDAD